MTEEKATDLIRAVYGVMYAICVFGGLITGILLAK